jgi:hypothetical protein
MFGKLLHSATSGVTSLIAKYAVRASVAIPFLFAFGFGLAGLTVVLIDEFGYRDAYFLLAIGFVAAGLLAAGAVWLKERADGSAERAADTDRTAQVASSAVQTAKHLPAALAGGTADASSSFRDLASLAARNWPLIIAGAIVMLLAGGSAPGHRHGRYGRL